MIFLKEAKIYATVWNVDPKEKYTDIRISTSEKKRDSDERIYSNWFARCIGHAHNSARSLAERDRIVITQAKLSNELYQDKKGEKKSALRFIITGFDKLDAQSSPGSTSSQGTDEEEDGDTLPY